VVETAFAQGGAAALRVRTALRKAALAERVAQRVRESGQPLNEAAHESREC